MRESLFPLKRGNAKDMVGKRIRIFSQVTQVQILALQLFSFVTLDRPLNLSEPLLSY